MCQVLLTKSLGEYTEFKKTKFNKNTTDDFGFCHVFYDDNDCCEALELFENAEVEYNGKLIFPSTKAEIVNIIDDIEPDEYGGISKKIFARFQRRRRQQYLRYAFWKKGLLFYLIKKIPPQKNGSQYIFSYRLPVFSFYIRGSSITN